MPRWRMYDKGLLKNIMMKLKFIFSEPRWSIIRIIGESTKSTNEIYEEIQRRGFSMPRPTLYYYLSGLEDAGIIEMAGYIEEGGGAPEKTWRLRIKKVEIDLLSGEMNI